MSKLSKALKVTVDKTKDVHKALDKLTENVVLVGIPDDPKAKNRKGDDGKPVTVSNADIGYHNEHGDPEHNVPARPHLVPGVKDALPKTTDYLKQGAKLALEGKVTAVDKAMNAAGVAAVNAVRAKISSNIPPKLSDRTLASRKAHGRTGTQTLVDTAQYRTAQTYVIRKRDT